MAVSRRRSVESVEYLESSYEENGNRTSGENTRDSLDASDLNSSFGSGNLEDNKDGHVVDYEREEGDGQEYESDEGQTITSGSSVGLDDHENIAPKSEKKLDDDEDRRNPQYIPKRGTFYEHDDRTADDDGGVTNTEKEAERAKEQLEKKKVWKEHENRWAHDRFNEDEQTPKTRDELVELYGYDIRSEEGPPRARRRRRYGRGPNKYTRNWEDEDAYNKANSVSGQSRGGRRGGPRSEGDRNGSNRRRSEDDLHVNDQRRSEEKSSTYYSSKVSGRRDDRRDNREAFPALPGTDSRRSDNHRPRSPQEERPKINAPTNPAWRKESPNSQNHALREEYPKPRVINNTGPLQLTPPPVRREVEVGRRRMEDVPASVKTSRETTKIESQTAEFEPVRKGAGRGIMGSGRRGGKTVEVSPPAPVTRGPGGIVQRGIYRGRVNPGRGVSERESRSEPPADQVGGYQQAQGPKLRTQDDLARDLARMSVYSQSHSVQNLEAPPAQLTREFTRKPQPEAIKVSGGVTYQRQTVVPPRLQQQEAAANRPKRYSSLRQRSLPESGAPAVQPPQPQAYSQAPHQYYQAGYVQQPVYGEAPQQQLPPQPPLQMMHPPTTFAAAFPSPTTFIQPVLRRPPSPHYLPPPPPPQAVINFVQPQAQFGPQPYPPFQGYTAVNPAPPPTELYQPQGGITYYSPEEQVVPRAITRRQRSAIPIVPPPERIPRGRGRVVDSEAYDSRAGYVDPGDLAEYEERGDRADVEYGEQYQDYEAPGENALEAVSDPSRSPYRESGVRSPSECESPDRSRTERRLSEDRARPDYEMSTDDARSAHEVSEDRSPSDSEVIENLSRTECPAADDRAESDRRVVEDLSRPHSRLSEDRPKSVGSVDQLSPGSETSTHTEQSQASTDAHEDLEPSHEGVGERAKSSASDDKYEDAAEVITHELQPIAS